MMNDSKDTKGELLRFIGPLKTLTEEESQAIRNKDFVNVESVQEKKATVREAILRLEAPAIEGKSRFAEDPDVEAAVQQVMKLDQANSEHLTREMASMKQSVETQTQTGTTLRRVHRAYAQRQTSASWQAVT
jgi:hypothetical protein